MSKKDLKTRKVSMIDITRKYANDDYACVQFFIQVKRPTGFYCKKCSCTHHYYTKRHNVLECTACKHQHYLFAGTIFQDNKLELYKLILCLYLFFSSNKGCSGIEMVNYKTALRLCRKCRILMAQSSSNTLLDSLFYESDVVYVGTKSEGKVGLASEKQPFLIVLSTDKENAYPRYIKLMPIPVDNSDNISRFVKKQVVLSKERIMNTDGKTTYSILKNDITLVAEKIVYKEETHRLKWLNIIWGNSKNNLLGIHHGLSKRDLPLFIQEQQWRFNHRNIGTNITSKIQQYILNSNPYARQESDSGFRYIRTLFFIPPPCHRGNQNL